MKLLERACLPSLATFRTFCGGECRTLEPMRDLRDQGVTSPARVSILSGHPGWTRPIRYGMRVKGGSLMPSDGQVSCRPRHRQCAADAGIGFTGVGRSCLSSISTALTNRLSGVYSILKGRLLVDARLRKRLAFPDPGARMRQSALAS